MISKYLKEDWCLLGRPWVDSEFAGMSVLAGDEDPHRGVYLFSVDTTDDIDDDAAREIAAHVVDVHNRALAEGNKLQHCWLDKLRAEQRRVGMLETQVAELQQQLDKIEDAVAKITGLEHEGDVLSDLAIVADKLDGRTISELQAELKSFGQLLDPEKAKSFVKNLRWATAHDTRDAVIKEIDSGRLNSNRKPAT